MPFASEKQRTYLRLNKPDIYKKFKKDMKSGGKIYKVENSGQQIVAKQYGGKVNGSYNR